MANEIVLILLFSAFYGMTMKIADLLNEHGLKFFRGSNIIFGILWGALGASLIYLNPIIANLILAMNIAFLIRGSLDYPNHQIASSIIIISFFFFSSLQPLLFFISLAIFTLFGILEDNSHKFKKNKLLFYFADLMFYYPIFALTLSILYNNWIIFTSFALFSLFYNLAKYYYKSKRYY